ncbi:MAG: hypothetical protein ABR540_06115 [Acidimicrobiales bacterium]|nr:hypothetical protein [Chloroflexota bacterium]
MAEILRLRLRQVLRTVASSVPGRLLAFVAAGMVLAVAIQYFVIGDAPGTPLGPDGPSSGPLQAEVGYAVLLAVALSLFTGAQSSRFPCTPADVAWIYASPVPIGHVILAQLVWQAARRCIFWVLGGLVVDVVGTFALDSIPGAFLGRAVLATPLLAGLAAVSVGAGSTRGSTAPARATVALGVAIGAAVLTPLLVLVVTGSTAGEALDGAAFSPLARSVGGVLFGEYDLLALVALAAMAVLAVTLCRAGGAGLREQLTLDAAFWADFSMTSMRSTVAERKPSFRHLSSLTGPWSILWFEVAVLRRANYQRWSLLVLVVTSILTAGFAPELVPLFAYAAPVSVVTGSYLSGLARHLRLRNLLLVPGGMVSRVAAAEAVHVVLACVGLALSLTVGGLAGGYGPGEIAVLLLQGVALLVLAFSVRVAAAAMTVRDGVLPGGLFHLSLAVATAGATALFVAISWLGSKIGAPTSAALVALLAVASLLLGAVVRLLEARVEWGAPQEEPTVPADVAASRS